MVTFAGKYLRYFRRRKNKRCLQGISTMSSYKDITWYFGLSLSDKDFQAFLTDKFPDLTKYNILESDYIESVKNGIEFGFQNKDAIYDEDDKLIFKTGNPIFSNFTLYPQSQSIIGDLPFAISFTDTREDVTKKAGKSTQTKEGYADFLKREFLVDNYLIDDHVLSVDYDFDKFTINFIQFRDNNLVDHIKL
jgi:hypothetical protein